MFLSKSKQLEAAAQYDEHGFRVPVVNPEPGLTRTRFPSDVARHPLRGLTTNEQGFLCDWLDNHRRSLVGRFKRSLGISSFGKEDMVNTCLAEGVFSLIDEVCQHKEERTPRWFDACAWVSTLGGMMKAWRAIYFLAAKGNVYGRGEVFTCSPMVVDGDQPDFEDTLVKDHAEAEAQRLIAARREAGRAIPEQAGLGEVLAKLDPIRLHIVSRYYGDDAEIQEIAEELGLTYKQVYKRIERVFPTLRKRLAELEPGVIHGR